jgi:hypothetical protein
MLIFMFRYLFDGDYRQQVRKDRENQKRFARILLANNSIMLDYKGKDV